MLAVKLQADLPAYRVRGLFAAIRQHPGVVSVTNLEAISKPTLEAIMLAPEPVQWRKGKSPFEGIRRYHRRRRQPELGL